jgi:hypothetical protein
MSALSPSLTGSECGVPTTHTTSVSVALTRLNASVGLCAWIIGIAMTVQLVIWGLASFTEMRWSEIGVTPVEVPLVVSAAAAQETAVRSALDDPPPAVKSNQPAVDPNRVPSRFERLFAAGAALAHGIGTMSALVLVPLIGLGVLLAVASATNGVDMTVSAFGWALVVGLMVLPIGESIGMPWEGGGLWSYESLVDDLDRNRRAGGVAIFGRDLMFFARYLLLPVACSAGITLVATRFATGVAAGAVRKEDLRLDAALEGEAGNVKITTLHGGRAANAMPQSVAELGPKVHTPPPPESRPELPAPAGIQTPAAATAVAEPPRGPGDPVPVSKPKKPAAEPDPPPPRRLI